MTTIAMISLGCSKNRVDGEHILGGLAARGFRIIPDPNEAEVVLVNTCGFIREAVVENVDEILYATRHKEEGVCKVLAVSGCLVKRYPDMAEELPEVDFFFTPEDIPRIPEILAAHLGKGQLREVTAPSRFAIDTIHTNYLKIAEGCSNRCTYCTIPDIRGGFRSILPDKLVAEARELARLGAVELNVVAQDVNSYGKDYGDPQALTKLVSSLEEIEGVQWLRLLYAYPRPFPGGLVERLGEGGKLLPYLDVPIQHSDPRILKAMGRKVELETMRDFFIDLRAKVPGIVLRTTAIVGFPGETDAEFSRLVDFIREIRFNHLGVFAYSPEDGTPAAEIEGEVDVEVVTRRMNALLEAQSEISLAYNRSLIGETVEVMIDGVDEDGRVVGRTKGQAPEVDGVTLLGLAGDEPVDIGAIIKAQVVDGHEYDLVAEPVG